MLGLPRPGGALTQKARALGAPVLLSANAFAVYARRSSSAEQRRFLRFTERLLAHLDGIDEVVLDSAGFVCHRLMERFPWSADAYVAFASNPRFKRWSSLDFACELEIAQTPEVVSDRIVGTHDKCLPSTGRVPFCTSRAPLPLTAATGPSAERPVSLEVL